MEEKRKVAENPLEDGGIGETVSAMETREGTSSTPAETSSDDEEKTDQGAKVDNADQKPEIHNELDEQIQEMIAKLEEMGPTISRYQYDEASNEVVRLASEMKEKAMSTMIHHLQMVDFKNSQNVLNESRLPQQAAYRSNSKASASFCEIEKRLKELEKQSNKFARRIKEHKREQATTLEMMQTLEARAFLEEQKDFIKNMLSRVPTENDLQNLETIRLMLMERKRAESRIQLLNMRASALDRAMGAIAKSSWFVRAGQSSSTNDRPDPRDLNPALGSNRDITSNRDIFGNHDIISSSHDIISSSRDIDTGSSSHGSKLLPDFTKMSVAKREAFLSKHFDGRSSDSPNGSQRGNAKKTKTETPRILEDSKDYDVLNVWSDESGKSNENSGITIVTMNSEETANSTREPKARTSAPKDPSDVETERHPDVTK
uniref:Kinesin heavy chain n=1 Tax=Lygus hesperus TaxID=30085 RepID=A0A0A9W0D5_LYGHE